MRHILFFILVISWPGSLVLAQQQFISGQVEDSNATPLENVSIQVLNTDIRIQTDVNGNFRIPINQDSKVLQLLFTSVGFERKVLEVNLQQSTEIKVVLKALSTELDEVVVSTGYQTLPKERATGSFIVVDGALFNTRISTDVISRLDGLVPGLLFENGGDDVRNLQLRGRTTLAASSTGLATPLIILDNFPYEGDVNTINPNDVETITFLKDAAAASIWGAKAGNGVIVITTKKASYNQPFNLTLSSNFGFSEKPNLWYVPQMSSSDYIDMEIFLFDKGAYNANLANTTNRPVVSPVVELLDKVRKGDVTSEEAMRQIDGFRNLDLRNYYDRYFYRSAFKQQYSMNLSGGNGKLSYLFSSGWDKNLSSLKENEMDRLTLRSINSFKPLKNLEIGIGVTYSVAKNQNNNDAPFSNLGSVAGSRSMYPYAQLADERGNALALPQNYRISFVENAGEKELLDWKYYPLEEIYQKDNNTQTKNMLFDASVNYKLSTWLNAGVRYNYQNQMVDLRDLKSVELFSTRDWINRFTVIEDEKVIRNLPLGSILDYRRVNLQSHNIRGQLNIDKAFGNNHQINGVLGGEIRSAQTDIDAGVRYGYDDYLKISSQVDYVNRYPIFARLSSDQNIPFRDSYSQSVDRFVSIYANASYRYLDRYTLSASARRDASNLFGVSTNNKWKPLWSVGGKWDIHKEGFYRSEFIPSLGIRITYGYSGNVNNSVPAVVTIDYQNTLSPLGRYKFAYLENAVNPELRWEKNSQLNFALDFSTNRNIVSGSIEYYTKNSTDLIAIMDSDPTIGFNTITGNSANMRNRGWEVSLNSNNLMKQVSWKTDLIFSYNKNKLTKYLYSTRSFSTAVNGSLVPLESGYPLNSLFSYRWHGLDPTNGDPQGYYQGDVSKDYIRINNPSSLEDLYFHGSLFPQYFGNVRNTFGYKRIFLSFNISGQFDYYFRKQTINYSTLSSPNGVIGHGDYEIRWKKTGDELNTTIPSFVYPANFNRDNFYGNSQATVEKGDHIRLQDLNMTYQLTGGCGFLKNANITCYVNNINKVLWKATKKNIDPYSKNRTPTPRSIAIGITTNF